MCLYIWWQLTDFCGCKIVSCSDISRTYKAHSEAHPLSIISGTWCRPLIIGRAELIIHFIRLQSTFLVSSEASGALRTSNNDQKLVLVVLYYEKFP